MNLSLLSIFGAGVLTFASPCVLPLVPVYFAMLAGTRTGADASRPGRLLATTLSFAAGLASVFVLLGMGASVAGRALAAHRSTLLVVGAAGVTLFGLKLLGVIRIPLLDREYRPGLDRARTPSGSLIAAWFLGAAFALGWTPCIGPVLGAVLTYTASRTAHPATGALYLAMYAAGLTLPLVIASAFASRVIPLLRRLQPHVRKLEIVTGLALVGFGALLATDRLGLLTAWTGPGASVASPAVAASAHCDTGVPGAVACATPTNAGGTESHAAGVLPAGPAVVEFVSGGCTVCRRMAPVVSSVARACSPTTLARIDVGDPGGGALARRLNVIGVPTFVMLDGQGHELERLVGEQSENRLEEAFENAAGHRCEGAQSGAGES